MFKKVVALLMAAAMTLSMATLPAGEVKAAGKNHAAEYNVDFQREAEESRINLYFGRFNGEWTEKSFDVSMKVFVPKKAMENGAFYISSWMGVYVNEEDEDEDQAGDFKYADWSKRYTVESGEVTKQGDFYCINVNMPLDKFVKWSDEAGEDVETEIPEKYAKVSLSAWLRMEGVKYKGSIYVDDITVKSGDKVVYDENFEVNNSESQYGYWINGNWDNKLKAKIVSFSGKALEVAKKALTVKVGKTVKAKATAYPAGKITYKSSNKKVATVDKNGVIKGIKKGTATITVKANGRTEKIKVTVK